MARIPRTPSNALRLRVSLVNSDPEIWRELEVDADLALAQLHDVLQISFGWGDAHPHTFTDHDPFTPRHDLPRIGRRPRDWAQDDVFSDRDENVLSEREWTLAQVFDGFDGPLYYEYDPGDGWTHQIELVERIDSTADAPRARLRDGARRGPLEDSGGVGGYQEKLAILQDPQHPQHDEIKQWMRRVAGPWTSLDPAAFDVEDVNYELDVRFTSGLGMSGWPTDIFPGDAKPPVRRLGTAISTPLMPQYSAIIDVLERLPVPLRIRLRAVLHRSGALEPVEIDAETAAAMVEPYLRTPLADKYTDDPIGLWRMLADSITQHAESEAGHDAAVLIAIGIATAPLGDRPPSGYEADDFVLALEALGWTSADGSPLREEVAQQLANSTLALLDSLGVFERDGGMRSGVSDGGRAFARAMLRSPVE